MLQKRGKNNSENNIAALYKHLEILIVCTKNFYTVMKKFCFFHCNKLFGIKGKKSLNFSYRFENLNNFENHDLSILSSC